jgi:hypothetical protein
MLNFLQLELVCEVIRFNSGNMGNIVCRIIVSYKDNAVKLFRDKVDCLQNLIDERGMNNQRLREITLQNVIVDFVNVNINTGKINTVITILTTLHNLIREGRFAIGTAAIPYLNLVIRLLIEKTYALSTLTKLRHCR